MATNIGPTPRPRTRKPGSTSAAYVASAPAVLSSSAPAAETTRPTAISRRGPACAIRWEATAALSVIIAASGRNSRPVTIAEAPSTCCRNSELRKMTPTRAPVTPAMTAEAETSERSFQMCGVTSGLATLRSMSANAISSTAGDGGAAHGRGRGPAVAVGALRRR